MHFMALHVHGSSNPIGISGNMDRLPMHSYFIFKDLITVFVFIFIFSLFIYFSPNTMGHSDNYIPGNPMVTPASIEKNKNLTKDNSSKDEILELLESNKSNKSTNEDFRIIMNGLFQAEGHIGGEFTESNSIKFRPLVFISLNASLNTIELFKLLNSKFNNKLNYLVSLNDSGIYHIRIYTRNWDIIINEWIPYFNNCYGDKQRGLKILLKLYYLVNLFKKSKDDKSLNEYKIKFIYLVYNIVDNSQRQLSLYDKIHNVIGNTSKDIDYNKLNIYLKSIIKSKDPKMSILFILGFYLGDGSFNIYIRHEEKSLWYRPQFRISQKYTEDNHNLLINIQDYLNGYNIKSHITLPKNKTMVLITIDSIKNIKILNSEFSNYSDYYFNKSDQLYLLGKACILLGKVKVWREGNLILLSLIYSMYNKDMLNETNIQRNKNHEMYKDIINNYFDENQDKNYFISLNKNKEWVVTLPINIKPKRKYFIFINSKSEIVMKKSEALKLAIKYRNTTLRNWLIDNKLI